MNPISTFGCLCDLLNNVIKMKKKNKIEVIQLYLNEYKRAGLDLYPLLRMLCCSIDNTRVFGIKESVLAKLYTSVLGLDVKKSRDAEALLNWRAPNTSGKGDFASVLLQIIVPRSTLPQNAPSPAIMDIDEKLNQLASDQESQQSIIRYFFTHCTCNEQLWLVRIILKDLKIGVSYESVMNALHPDAVTQFQVKNDLKYISTLTDRAIRIKTAKISLFHAFGPMLSSRTGIDEVTRKHFKSNVQVV